jgi:hypothetical protein
MSIRLASIVSVIALGVATTSCTASLELDRFRTDESAVQAAPINVSYYDVKFTAKSMLPHFNETFEVRVVDRLNHVQAKAIYNEMVYADFTLYLARVVPKANSPYRLDFWADHNMSSRYDGIQGGVNEKDHAWRRVLADPLPEDMRLVGSRYELEFLHDTAFVDIFTDLDGNPISGEDTLLPCDMNVDSPGYVGKMIELRVVDKASGRLVGLYRQGRGRETFHALIPGILDEQTAYEVSAYVDMNDDGKYDAGEPSFKVEFMSSSTGAVVDIDLTSLPQVPIDTGEQSTP